MSRRSARRRSASRSANRSRAGRRSSRTSFLDTCSGARTCRTSGSTASTIRGRATRSGAGLSSSRATSAGKALTLVRNPRYWGPHLARFDRLVLRYDVVDPVASILNGDVDIVGVFPPAVPQALRSRTSKSSPFPVPPMTTSPSGSGPEATPLCTACSFDGPLRTASTGRRSGVRSADAASPSRASSTSPRVPTSARTGRATTRGRPSPASCSLRLGASVGRTASTRARGDGPRCASLRVPSPTETGGARGRAGATAEDRRRGRSRVVPNPQFAATFVPRGQFDVALFGWQFEPEPAAATPIYSCGGADNYTGYCSRPVSRLLAQASRTLDPAAQARILNAADRMIAADVPVLPLFQITPPTAVRTGVRGYAPAALQPLRRRRDTGGSTASGRGALVQPPASSSRPSIAR